MAEKKQRLVGIEQEWGMTQKFSTGKHEPVAMTSHLLWNLPEGVHRSGPSSSSAWLSNGARYYIDSQNIPELSSPEVSINELPIYEMAGERIAMHGLVRALEKDDRIVEGSVTKRVVDDDNHTMGIHLNVLAERNENLPTIKEGTAYILGLHMATSPALFGMGYIQQRAGNGPRYSLWQKAHTLERDFNNATTTSKPLINVKDEPHADNKMWLRIHLTSTDSHISAWASRMQAGTVSLVTRAMEEGRGRDLRLADDPICQEPLVRLSKAVATDLELKHNVELMDGKRATAIDIQRRIIAIVKQTDHTDEEAEIIREWERAIDDLERDMMLLQDRSDAIAKLALLHHIQTKENLSGFDHKVLKNNDKLYDQLLFYRRIEPDDPGEVALQQDPAALYAKSLPAYFRRSPKYFGAWTPDEASISKAVVDPPDYSRAHLRGQAVKEKSYVSIDWEHIKKEDKVEDAVKLSMIKLSPYQTDWPAETA